MPPLQITVEFVVAGSIAIALLLALIRTYLRARRQHQRLVPVLSVDEEVARLKRECDALESQRRTAQDDLVRVEDVALSRQAELDKHFQKAKLDQEQTFTDLRGSYATAKATHDRLQASVKDLEEDLESIDVGLYRPHFDFEDSESYKQAIQTCREDIKRAIKNDGAVVWGTAWTIEGSASKGERMQKQYGKLMLRAFNGECEAAIARVRWNNVTKLEARLERDFKAISRLGTVMTVELNVYYLGLRLKELRLVYEHSRKKREEAEEQRQIREQMREEERAQRELDKAKQEADADERRFQQALERARKEAARAKGIELEGLSARVRELEESLSEAHARGERAMSRAQLTKSGHVYVISNTGSFGSDVIKIGMTRRLDPQDRVKELGDASVPFGFDVHAMIFSEDAPSLEAMLHRQFANDRVNLVNSRKEFFRVGIADVAGFAESLGLDAELTLVAEAREYRETVARRSALAGVSAPENPVDEFPSKL